MMGITGVVIFMYYAVMLSYLIYLYGRYRLCPEFIWGCMQLVMFFGITHFINTDYDSDMQLVVLYLLALICFIISSSYAQLILKPKRVVTVQSRPDWFRIRKPYIWVMMLFSIVLCGLFFVRGGGNVFINGLRALITGAKYSTKYSRMGLLSVSGVGYIYQLRVIIFPLLVLYYIMINKMRPMSFILAVFMLAFLVGTGQRGGLFSYIAIVLICLYFMLRKDDSVDKRKRPNKFLLYGGILGVAGILFALSTIMNGRVAEGSSVFSAILTRFIEDNQSCAVEGFRFIKEQPIQYGKDWIMQLFDILPGKNNYVSLDTRIFAYMHGGSMERTSPACIWGSAYYNFGVFGVILLSCLLGFVTTKIHAIYTRKTCDESNVIIYSALQFLLAYWVAAGPVVLFNSGFVSVLLLDFVFKFALKYRIVFGKYRL